MNNNMDYIILINGWCNDYVAGEEIDADILISVIQKLTQAAIDYPDNSERVYKSTTANLNGRGLTSK